MVAVGLNGGTGLPDCVCPSGARRVLPVVPAGVVRAVGVPAATAGHHHEGDRAEGHDHEDGDRGGVHQARPHEGSTRSGESVDKSVNPTSLGT